MTTIGVWQQHDNVSMQAPVTCPYMLKYISISASSWPYFDSKRPLLAATFACATSLRELFKKCLSKSSPGTSDHTHGCKGINSHAIRPARGCAANRGSICRQEPPCCAQYQVRPVNMPDIGR